MIQPLCWKTAYTTAMCAQAFCRVDYTMEPKTGYRLKAWIQGQLKYKMCQDNCSALCCIEMLLAIRSLPKMSLAAFLCL